MWWYVPESQNWGGKLRRVRIQGHSWLFGEFEPFWATIDPISMKDGGKKRGRNKKNLT